MEVRVVCDSIGVNGVPPRLTTLLLRCPLRTYAVLSECRMQASMHRSITTDPVRLCSDAPYSVFKESPEAEVRALATTSRWRDLLRLMWQRCQDVEPRPDVLMLIEAIEAALQASQPQELEPVELDWHLPFIDPRRMSEDEFRELETGIFGAPLCGVGPYEVELLQEGLLKISAARCARVLLPPQIEPERIAGDLALYERLADSPLIAMMSEHQAMPDRLENGKGGIQWQNPTLHRCEPGWISRQAYRQVSNHAAA